MKKNSIVIYLFYLCKIAILDPLSGGFLHGFMKVESVCIRILKKTKLTQCKHSLQIQVQEMIQVTGALGSNASCHL